MAPEDKIRQGGDAPKLRLQTPEDAPLSVLLLGWSLVVVAAFVMISAAAELSGSYRALSVMLWGSGSLRGALEARMPPHIESWLFFRAVSNVLQLGAMGVAVFAALNFLQLKEWGRRLLEQVAWFEIVFQASSRLYYVVNIKDFVPGEGAASAVTWTVAGLGSWLIFLVLVLRYLSSGGVKEAMRRPGA